MKTVKQQFAQRLREAMQRAGYEPRPAVLEREFNLRYWGKPMTLHGVRRWLLGETMPDEDKLVVLAEWLDIEPQQLHFGTEVATRTRDRQARWEAATQHRERETFEAFLALPEPQKRVVREVIRALTITKHAKR